MKLDDVRKYGLPTKTCDCGKTIVMARKAQQSTTRGPVAQAYVPLDPSPPVYRVASTPGKAGAICQQEPLLMVAHFATCPLAHRFTRKVREAPPWRAEGGIIYRGDTAYLECDGANGVTSVEDAQRVALYFAKALNFWEGKGGTDAGSDAPEEGRTEGGSRQAEESISGQGPEELAADGFGTQEAGAEAPGYPGDDPRHAVEEGPEAQPVGGHVPLRPGPSDGDPERRDRGQGEADRLHEAEEDRRVRGPGSEPPGGAAAGEGQREGERPGQASGVDEWE